MRAASSKSLQLIRGLLPLLCIDAYSCYQLLRWRQTLNIIFQCICKWRYPGYLTTSYAL